MMAGDVAGVLAEIAVLSELNGENPFRARAFAAAARSLEGSDVDLARLAREGKLTSLPGIGSGIAEAIRELVETGRSALYEELRTATPVGLFDVMRIPGLGPKRIHTLHATLGIDSLDSLEAAARDGRLAAAPGFGKKTAQKILDGIDFVRDGMRRRRFPEAYEAALRMLAWLRTRPEVERAEIAGPLRRRMEVIEAIDLVAATDQAGSLAAAFGELNGVEMAPDSAGCATARLADGFTVRLHCVDPDRWAAALLRATGSDAHLAALADHAAGLGVRLTRDGVEAEAGGQSPPLADEAAVYAALGLPWIAPELREGMGEVALAAAGELPRLVELAELRGTFHCHTVYSDGRASVAEMAEAAAARGWEYLGLADHSQSAAYAGGLTPARVREQQAEIDAWNAARAEAARTGGSGAFRIFKGIESDILADGSLDYDDDVLASFDYVVGSVHSGFGMSEAEMTARIVRAVRNPYLTILGHPTGRLLLTRGGYPLDVRAVLDAAAEAGVVVEINANPHRLDLDWRHLRYAAERGVLIAINPDAHSVDGLDDVEYGVSMARKGGLDARRILNSWTTAEVEEYLARRKARIQGGA
jgi:DNA polymerase (family X)